MRRIILFSLFLALCALRFTIYASPVHAAQNNRFGVHILFPEEVKEAAELVNSSGGDWGYVVIPIQSIDRSREKWQAFMDECRASHLIPILRLATYPKDNYWTKPTEWDSVDFANFLHDLDWPTAQKIVAVYNEPNHAKEWGGEIHPFEYTETLRDTIEQFKTRDTEFVMLNAGLDASAPSAGQNSLETMDEYEFMRQMMIEDSEIFQKIDGFNSHAYGNPGFSTSPAFDTRYNITSYQHELSYLQDFYGVYGLKVYITEGGWKENIFLSQEKIAEFYKIAYNEIWTDDYLRVTAPFILKADGSGFEGFGLIRNNQKTLGYQTIFSIRKEKGQPELTKKTYLAQYEIKETEIREYTADKKEKPIEERWWNKIVKWAFR